MHSLEFKISNIQEIADIHAINLNTYYYGILDKPILHIGYEDQPTTAAAKWALEHNYQYLKFSRGGGTIVSQSGDFSFIGIMTQGNYLINKTWTYFLIKKLNEYSGLHFLCDHNDIVLPKHGKLLKVGSTIYCLYNAYWYLSAGTVSLTVNRDDINSICTKNSGKIPTGLTELIPTISGAIIQSWFEEFSRHFLTTLVEER